MVHGRILLALFTISFAHAANQQELSRAELLKFRPQLGPMSAKQNVLFQEEVLSDPERFVNEIKRSESGARVQVDENAVKQVLAFDASSLGFKTEPVIGFASRVKAGCSVCEKEATAFKAKLQSRMERRGFVVKSLPGVEITEGSSDPFSQYALQQQLQGVMVVDVNQELRDHEAVIVGKVHFRILKPNSSTYFTSDEDFENLSADSLVNVGDRWLTRSWMRLGALASTSSTSIVSNSNRMNVEIVGCASLKQFHSLRTKLQEALSSASALAESSIELGKVSFWVEGYASSASISETLRKAFQTDESIQKIETTNSNTVTMNVKGDES